MELSALLQAAIANIHGQITEAAEINPEETEDRSLPADPSVRNFSYALVDDQLYYRENSRMILEAIYEPTFCEYSHGFRPNRSCHTALSEITTLFTGAKWVIEGDIKACFDSFDHHVI